MSTALKSTIPSKKSLLPSPCVPYKTGLVSKQGKSVTVPFLTPL